MELMGVTDLSRLLQVSKQQVWTWYCRREVNGFPEQDAFRGAGRGRLWDPEKVKAWKAGYTPQRGRRQSVAK